MLIIDNRARDSNGRSVRSASRVLDRRRRRSFGQKTKHLAAAVTAVFLAFVHVRALDARASAKAAQEAVFKAGVEVVDVSATVTDGNGRFIGGLTKDDFIVYDNGKPQEIVSFSSSRVPVSLAMLVDVSGSMTDDQLATARLAINRFVFDLLGKDDELFLMQFAGRGRILQSWTQDRERFSRALSQVGPFSFEQTGDAIGTVPPNYGSAVYDAVVTGLGFAARRMHRKSAVLLISDGRDTSSSRTLKQAQDAIRASEALVYALGVDDADTRTLRRLTDETGGRTEVVKRFKNLEEATARLAAEFTQQYLIGYAAPSRDGGWHTIKVEVRKKGAQIRARAGYTAS